jgi:exopolyphosphatase/guanosine-5'-triphosphate,3'-diphosphate pyrophosphatase
MRIAVVDIGSNSTRLLIADLSDGRVEDELDRESTVTRLGSGAEVDSTLQHEAMQRVYATLDEYRTRIDRHRADRAIAVLTSAVRDARNGSQFADEVGSRYRLDTHVLTGDEEARLTFLGATSEHDPADSTPTVVIDIGGGSTEVVIGAGREATFHVSTQAGVVRQTERHLHHDPPDQDDLDALAEDVRDVLAEGVPDEHRRGVQHAIAVAGTATSLAAIAQDLDPYDPQKVHRYVLRKTECQAIVERLAKLPLRERREVKGLHPDRAPTIVAGVIILLQTLGLFQLDAVEVSEHDILRGAALGLA